MKEGGVEEKGGLKWKKERVVCVSLTESSYTPRTSRRERQTEKREKKTTRGSAGSRNSKP